MLSKSNRIRLSCSVACVVLAWTVDTAVAQIGGGPIIVPFPIQPFADCGRVGLVPSIFEGEQCKVFIADSGGAYIAAGIENFDVGDRVFVKGQICFTCLTTCFAGALLNATVTPGCPGGKALGQEASDAVSDPSIDPHAERGGFRIAKYSDGQMSEAVSEAREMGFDPLEPGPPTMVAVDDQLLEVYGFVPFQSADGSLSTLVSVLPADAMPDGRGGWSKPPFDCSSCQDSFCTGTIRCVLVDCGSFCNYACTWVVGCP